MCKDGKSELSTLPTYELNRFALWVAKATEAYFQNPEVKRRFEEWKKEREEKQKLQIERGEENVRA